MNPRNPVLVPLLVSGLLAGCQGCQIESEPKSPAPTASGPPAPSLTEAIRAAERRMHDRYSAARRIEEAVVRSDLDRIHSEAHTIAELEDGAALPIWQPYFEATRSAARDIEATTNIGAAARTTATLGRRCAQCHSAVAAKIVFPKQEQPAGDKRLALQMWGHQWAAALMWEGLIGPSEALWNQGAEALSKAPLNIAAEGDPPAALGISDDIARVRVYATRARHAGAQDDRMAVLGDLLATCAHCHAVIRDR